MGLRALKPAKGRAVIATFDGFVQAEVMSEIRPAKDTDAFGIAKVHVETWRETYPTLVPTEYLVGYLDITQVASMWARRLRDNKLGDQCYVAVRGQDVLGYALWGAIRDTENTRFEAELYELYIGVDHQNMGLGRKLCQAVVARLDKYALGSLAVEVLEGNPARFFYENMGAKLIAVRERPFAGTKLPTLIYGWENIEVPQLKAGSDQANDG